MNHVLPPELIHTTVEQHFHTFSKTSQVIYIFVLLFIFVSFVALFFVNVQETVQSKGIFRSISEPAEIISPLTAQVIRVVIRENRYVNKGDTLVWLNNLKILDKIRMLKEQVALHERWADDLNCLQNESYTLIRTDMIRAMADRYHQVIAEFDLQRELTENRLERTVHLHKNEVIPLVEKEEPEFLLKKTISEKNTFVAQSLIEWRQLSSDYLQTIRHLRSEISGLQNDLESYVILAPCSGYLSKNHGIRKGSFVTAGQTLALVVPDEQLVSEHLVHSKDIGLLHIQMPVIFQVDAYPYQQWGLASGKIAEISKDVYIVEGTPYFKVKCTLDKQWLIHENGNSGNFKNGLTNTGRFITAHRTLSQWIFDKADRNLNPARID